MRKLLLVILLASIVGFFRTGCGPSEAQAKNVMLAASSWFKVIDGLVVSGGSPADGAVGIGTTEPIERDVTHSLPITSVSMIVQANGMPIDGTLVVTNKLTGGKHVKWTPANPYPPLADIVWTINATVDNGQ